MYTVVGVRPRHFTAWPVPDHMPARVPLRLSFFTRLRPFRLLPSDRLRPDIDMEVSAAVVPGALSHVSQSNHHSPLPRRAAFDPAAPTHLSTRSPSPLSPLDFPSTTTRNRPTTSVPGTPMLTPQLKAWCRRGPPTWPVPRSPARLLSSPIPAVHPGYDTREAKAQPGPDTLATRTCTARISHTPCTTS